MKKCKNCGHEVIQDKYVGVRHHSFSNFVFPHYDCTEDCKVKGCKCNKPEVKV